MVQRANPEGGDPGHARVPGHRSPGSRISQFAACSQKTVAWIAKRPGRRASWPERAGGRDGSRCLAAKLRCGESRRPPPRAVRRARARTRATYARKACAARAPAPCGRRQSPRRAGRAPRQPWTSRHRHGRSSGTAGWPRGPRRAPRHSRPRRTGTARASHGSRSRGDSTRTPSARRQWLPAGAPRSRAPGRARRVRPSACRRSGCWRRDRRNLSRRRSGSSPPPTRERPAPGAVSLQRHGFLRRRDGLGVRPARVVRHARSAEELKLRQCATRRDESGVRPQSLARGLDRREQVGTAGRKLACTHEAGDRPDAVRSRDRLHRRRHPGVAPAHAATEAHPGTVDGLDYVRAVRHRHGNPQAANRLECRVVRDGTVLPDPADDGIVRDDAPVRLEQQLQEAGVHAPKRHPACGAFEPSLGIEPVAGKLLFHRYTLIVPDRKFRIGSGFFPPDNAAPDSGHPEVRPSRPAKSGKPGFPGSRGSLHARKSRRATGLQMRHNIAPEFWYIVRLFGVVSRRRIPLAVHPSRPLAAALASAPWP